MHSPTTAMLWAAWHLTRARIMFLMVIMLAAGWVALSLPTNTRDGVRTLISAVAVLLGLVWPVSTRFIGNSGFPFDADFARPIPTWKLVAVPMLYVGAATAAVYAVPLLVLGAAFGVSFALLPVAAPIATLIVVVAACSWWTRSNSVRVLGGITVPLGLVMLWQERIAIDSRDWTDVGALDPVRYGFLALVVGGAFALVRFGVERQRRGDVCADWLVGPEGARGTIAARLAGIWRHGWLELFRAPCPTSSPLRAELWLEMKTRGTRVLAAGVVVALTIPIAMWATNALGWDPGILLVASTATIMIPLFVGINTSLWTRGNAWFTRWSAFEAARALPTARLVGLEVLVTAVCALAAWAAIWTSIWLSAPLLSDVRDTGWLQLPPGSLTVEGLLGPRPASAVTIALVWFAALVALLVSLRSLSVAFGVRLYAAGLGLGLYLLGLLLAGGLGWVGPSVAVAHVWGAAAAVPLGTVLVFRRAIVERLLTWRNAGGALVIWSGFAALYLSFLKTEVLSAATPAPLAALVLSTTLLPLAAVAFAPWSFGLIRHT